MERRITLYSEEGMSTNQRIEELLKYIGKERNYKSIDFYYEIIENQLLEKGKELVSDLENNCPYNLLKTKCTTDNMAFLGKFNQLLTISIISDRKVFFQKIVSGIDITIHIFKSKLHFDEFIENGIKTNNSCIKGMSFEDMTEEDFDIIGNIVRIKEYTENKKVELDVSEVDELDTVDAMVFSGDKLHNEEMLDLFEHCLKRWSLEVISIKKMLDERNKMTPEEKDLYIKEMIEEVISNEKRMT